MVRVHLVFAAPFVLLQRISSLPFNCLNDRSRALHAHHNTIRPFEIEVPKRPRVSVPKEKSFFFPGSSSRTITRKNSASSDRGFFIWLRRRASLSAPTRNAHSPLFAKLAGFETGVKITFGSWQDIVQHGFFFQVSPTSVLSPRTKNDLY